MNEPTFDPEVVQMLEEIASNEDSTLLKLPKRPLRHWIASPEEVVTPHGSHLTKAEKHLVMAYREEAAWVLLQGALAELRKDPLVFGIPPPAPGDLVHQARRSLRHHGDVETLRKLSEGDSLEVTTLTRASLSLAPHDWTRNVLAIGLERAGLDQESHAQIDLILKGFPSAIQRAQALENRVVLLNKQQSFDAALQCAEEAARSEDSLARLLAWCLTTALQSGNKEKAEEYCERLASHPLAGDLAALPSTLSFSRGNGAWAPTPDAVRVARSGREHSNTLLRGIHDAFV